MGVPRTSFDGPLMCNGAVAGWRARVASRRWGTVAAKKAASAGHSIALSLIRMCLGGDSSCRSNGFGQRTMIGRGAGAARVPPHRMHRQRPARRCVDPSRKLRLLCHVDSRPQPTSSIDAKTHFIPWGSSDNSRRRPSSSQPAFRPLPANRFVHGHSLGSPAKAPTRPGPGLSFLFHPSFTFLFFSLLIPSRHQSHSFFSSLGDPPCVPPPQRRLSRACSCRSCSAWAGCAPMVGLTMRMTGRSRWNLSLLMSFEYLSDC